MNWESLDWEVLDRLRETFLSDKKTDGPYWHTITDLECYDFTYGERIGWKWDAVLAELKQRGWSPAAGGTILDWGCGSGIAGRRVLDFFGGQNFSALFVHDHSPLAMEFAEHRARTLFPSLPVARADYRLINGDAPIGLLVVSHVLNELNDIARAELAGLLARAQAVLWVEPGTHEVSRALVGWREELRTAGFQVVAPCTHQAGCGLLAPENERHWCHHFADPPTGIYADSNWVKFGQRAGIDLRSLPYSFLVLDRRPIQQPADASRILGDPRLYKGYAKIFNCSAAGVEELTLQQRVDKELFKSLKRARGPLLYRWTRDKTQIVAAEPGLK
ncbi:MAG TPA: small ribosomal subunit Rsm22 family protein [Candidatus Didemnitutus sp.]|nr:small ribosomal subunit Rsm22 family protein [Candidatus Didemnitutus sp.]